MPLHSKTCDASPNWKYVRMISRRKTGHCLWHENCTVSVGPHFMIIFGELFWSKEAPHECDHNENVALVQKYSLCN